MKDTIILKKVNIITIFVCFIFCLYGVYEAEKPAQIKTYDIISSKIKEPTKLVMLSDLHIDVDVSAKKVKSIVDRVNELKPDVVVIVGDTVDNIPQNLYKQTEELNKFDAKYGTFITLGNHEFYMGAQAWGIKYATMGLNFLNNYGINIGNTGLYIAGIPDINAATDYNMPIKLDYAMYKKEEGDYAILLSHTPKVLDEMDKDKIDLILSGHTHGGQIFPFHYFTKQSNDGMLAGFYNQKRIDLYVSRGTRYWGPPMRILAPSEITVFNFIPKKDDEDTAK